ncbi:hypothetical protein [Streptomyces sp. BK79]
MHLQDLDRVLGSVQLLCQRREETAPASEAGQEADASTAATTQTR